MTPAFTSPAQPGPFAEFTVEFGAWTDAQGNRLFRGRGALRIDQANQAFAFSGRPRPLWGARPDEVTFRATDICNVVVGGASICMDIDGRTRRRFTFDCDSPAEARSIATRLPNRTNGEYEACRIFHTHMSLRGARAPWTQITNVMITLNVTMFIVMGFHGAGWIKVGSMLPYIQFAANNGAATTNGEWWRLLTSMFAHYGLPHLVLNMWALYRSGPLVERLLGRWSFTLVYLGSGLLGAVASILFHGDKVWSAGASGAIFGLYGALLGYMLREKHGLPRLVTRPLLISTLGFAGYNLVYGSLNPQIDNVCHMGGLLGGILLGWLAAPPLDPQDRMSAGPLRFWTAFGAGATLIAIGILEAPRFSYIPADQQTLSNAVKQTGQRELALLKRQATFLEKADEGDQPSLQALNTFVLKEAEPFYNDWLVRLGALKLRAGYQSEERRNGLSLEIRHRLGCYKRLVRDLKEKDPNALESFERDFALATAVPRS